MKITNEIFAFSDTHGRHRQMTIPEEGLQKMKETDYFVTHYPLEDLLPDVEIFPNAIIHGHDHGMGPAVCINSAVPIWNVSLHSRLFPEEYSEE